MSSAAVVIGALRVNIFDTKICCGHSSELPKQYDLNEYLQQSVGVNMTNGIF